jgi:hypothetical protein
MVAGAATGRRCPRCTPKIPDIFYVYWQTTPRQLFTFQADVRAADAVRARQEFQRLFPRDFVIGVKEAAGWDGRTLQGGRWLA